MDESSQANRGQEEARNVEDSASFLRCSTCGNANDVDPNAGTLYCKRHDMHVNAEADEIPDDCPEYSPANYEPEQKPSDSD